MSQPRVLVVYYSRGGNTRLVALEVARRLGAEVEEIGSLDRRTGVAGYSRCCYEAWSGRAAAIRAPRLDPGAFDLVVVATPVWVSALASPARAYLAAMAPRVRDVAFIVTLGGTGARRALRQLEEVAGRPPIASLVVLERELGDAAARAAVFVDELRARLQPASAGESRPRGKVA